MYRTILVGAYIGPFIAIDDSCLRRPPHHPDCGLGPEDVALRKIVDCLNSTEVRSGLHQLPGTFYRRKRRWTRRMTPPFFSAGRSSRRCLIAMIVRFLPPTISQTSGPQLNPIYGRDEPAGMINDTKSYAKIKNCGY